MDRSSFGLQWRRFSCSAIYCLLAHRDMFRSDDRHVLRRTQMVINSGKQQETRNRKQEAKSSISDVIVVKAS